MSDWSDPFYIPIEDGYTRGECIPFDVPGNYGNQSHKLISFLGS